MRTIVVLSLYCFFSVSVHAATVGQTDTFTNGTQGWIAPDPNNPNPPTTDFGGPGGVSDAYLRLVANGGAGAGSRLTVLNGGQWTGDFLGAGIGAIGMDVRNFGPADVYLRLLFEHMTVPNTPPVDLALSSNYVLVPAGMDWTHITFPIDPANLTAPIGTSAGALANTTVMRLFSNQAPAFGGPGNGPPAITVTLGVDNIQAIGAAAIPEPGTFVLLAAGLAVLVVRTRRVTE